MILDTIIIPTRINGLAWYKVAVVNKALTGRAAVVAASQFASELGCRVWASDLIRKLNQAAAA